MADLGKNSGGHLMKNLAGHLMLAGSGCACCGRNWRIALSGITIGSCWNMGAGFGSVQLSGISINLTLCAPAIGKTGYCLNYPFGALTEAVYTSNDCSGSPSSSWPASGQFQASLYCGSGGMWLAVGQTGVGPPTFTYFYATFPLIALGRSATVSSQYAAGALWTPAGIGGSVIGGYGGSATITETSKANIR